MSYRELKSRHRAERSTYPQNLSLRVHRALSWLDRAEQLAADADSRFIFLWIAFNAAYAAEINDALRLSEQRHFRRFVAKLIDLDRQGRIEDLVWQEFPGSIRLLIDNPFVFREFWAHQSGLMTEAEWKRRFGTARAAAHRALGGRRTGTVLGIALSRLYVLRNQLMHGGATWNGSVNRDQVRDGANLLGKLVPMIIELMMDNPGTPWGEPTFPVVTG